MRETFLYVQFLFRLRVPLDISSKSHPKADQISTSQEMDLPSIITLHRTYCSLEKLTENINC